jgi:benzoyl-CoA-dihydrodiol lyase
MADVKNEPKVPFDIAQDDWKSWSLAVDGDVATLSMNVPETGGLRPGYELKLNSYDLGVDIELYDAVQRVSFEHPQVKAVVVTSGLDRVFCSGANIYMLGSSSHPFKVNFCKFTNETRCSLEEPEMPTFIAAVNGPCAGGGYELAMACKDILLIDDGSSAVSLPEVPLLAVLPGTGGLTRLVDKRKVRRDIADIFCTKAEGFKARDAMKGRLVDAVFTRSKWTDGVASWARKAADAYTGPSGDKGIAWPRIGTDFEFVTLEKDANGRTATLTIAGPSSPPPSDFEAAGADAWCIKAFRELERCFFELRFNEQELGLLLVKTTGDQDTMLAWDDALLAAAEAGNWLAIRTLAFQRRTLCRFDNMSRSLFALVEENSNFAGTLQELALAADRTYMFLDDDGENCVRLGPTNGGTFPMANGSTRLANRFYGEPEKVDELLGMEAPIDAEEAEELGLVTMSLDDIDWEDEIRIAVEERASMSPDALTGMEQNIRFAGSEGTESRIYGRLTAWQNWIFQRPNAVGDQGALTVYGQPERPHYDFRRT